MYLPYNQFQDGPAKKTLGPIASAAMPAIVLARIAVGNNDRNSGSSDSSGGSVGGGGCGDKDFGGYTNGGGNRQQTTKDGSGRIGGRDSNGNVYNNNCSKGNDGGNGNSGDSSVPS